VSANASDNQGVAGVQFTVDSANFGSEDTSAPFSAGLNTLSLINGSHRLTAVARDTSGNRATSAVVTIVVNNLVTPPPPTNNDIVWFDDALPYNAVPGADGGDSWNWISSNPTSFSGAAAHQSNLSSTNHQHYFNYAWATLDVSTGDVLFAYVYLDPGNPPLEAMLQWNNGSWEHRAYWGANFSTFGVDGTASRRSMGPLPASGKWARLEVPARAVGLEGSTLKGMAFTLFGGRATWDRVGKRRSSAAAIKSLSGGITIIWPSEIGQSYRVLCKTNLNASAWTDISGLISATDETTTWIDSTVGGDSQRFYQIVQ
jgi:hypothetical protein